MSYSSSLSDSEWEVLEPLLVEILPPKKRTRPSNWTKRDIIDGIFYQLKNGCNWQDLPKDLPPYSTVYWHYKQWREAGAIEQLMSVLHGYHPEHLTQELEQVYPQILTKIQFELSTKPSKQEKAATGKSGFVPAIARWVIERSNAWMERCKILVKNHERSLANATTKLNLCFVRLMLKRLAAS